MYFVLARHLFRNWIYRLYNVPVRADVERGCQFLCCAALGNFITNTIGNTIFITNTIANTVVIADANPIEIGNTVTM